MAGVSRPAASNWRRRYDDFPHPVQESGTTTLFRFGELRKWMKLHNKPLVNRSADQAVWAALNPARGSLLPEDAAMAGMALLGYAAAIARYDDPETVTLRGFAGTDPHLCQQLCHNLARKADGADLPYIPFHSFDDRMPWKGEAESFLQEVARLALELGPPDVFEALLAASARGFKGAGELSTPTSVARLLTSLNPIRGTVVDPACGHGTLILTAGKSTRLGEHTRLFGCERIESASRLAQVRMLVHGIKAEITTGDTLHGGLDRELKADLVLADLPFASQWQQDLVDPRRLPFGLPPRNHAELVWIQYAISLLGPEGRALVVTAMGPLFRGGTEAEIRRRLVAAGFVRAIIALPVGLYSTTRLQPLVWVLADPGTDPTEEILFVDAADVGTRQRGRTELTDTDIARIVRAVQRGPAGGSNIPSAVASIDVVCARECDLTPARWITSSDAPVQLSDRIAQASQRLHENVASLISCAQIPLPSSGAPSSVRTSNIETLANQGVVSLVRPYRVDKAEVGHGDLPIVRPQDILFDFSATHGDVVDQTNMPKGAELTQPGDVLVLTEGRVRAGVDNIGGAAVAGPIQIVRPGPQSVSSEVLAAIISFYGRQQATGVTVPRIKLRSLEIPLLDTESAHSLGRALHLLGEQQRLAAASLRAAEDLTEALLLGTSAGLIWPALEGEAQRP
jgi:hypothetical protein